jgi:hypothetical protein
MVDKDWIFWGMGAGVRGALGEGIRSPVRKVFGKSL